jgi:uncharacterized small protein (DUF1192 family)
MENLFIKATRKGYRWIYKGAMNIEDLWQLSVTELDAIHTSLRKEVKELDTESLLSKKNSKITEYEEKAEIVKYILLIKVEEAEAATKAVANKQQKQMIDNIIAQKKNQALNEMSVEELEKMKASL